MNRQQFYFKMVISSLIRRRSRMFTALLAISLGAAILSGLITIYYDIPRQLGQEFRVYGANLIIIPSGNRSDMENGEAAGALSLIPKTMLVGAAPYRYRMMTINGKPFMAAGTDLNEAKKTSPYWYIQGHWPEEEGEALIGQEVASSLRLVQGKTFTVGGISVEGNFFSRDFTVAGIVQTGGNEEAFVFMDLGEFDDMFESPHRVDVVECSVSAPAETLERLSKNITLNFPAINARLVKRVTQSEGTVLTKLQTLIYLVTFIVLLLIMICMATTMMAVVTERRKEIGLRKALGASNKSLASEFLGEGIFLGMGGGVLGALLGFLFAEFVGRRVFGRDIMFQPLLVPATLAASALITALACVIPVRSASAVDPALVLRGE
jgi:putative ABC transport system permease protein